MKERQYIHHMDNILLKHKKIAFEELVVRNKISLLDLLGFLPDLQTKLSLFSDFGINDLIPLFSLFLFLFVSLCLYMFLSKDNIVNALFVPSDRLSLFYLKMLYSLLKTCLLDITYD